MKCKTNIRAIAKIIDRRPTTIVPLQKSPRKRPQLRKRPRQQRKAPKLLLRRKAVPPLAPRPTKAAKREAPEGAKISGGARAAPPEAGHVQNAPANGGH